MRRCLIPDAYVLASFARGLYDVKDIFFKQNTPVWLLAVIVILSFCYSVYRRWLYHKEKEEAEKTKRFEKAVDCITTIVKGDIPKDVLNNVQRMNVIDSVFKVESEKQLTLRKYLKSLIKRKNQDSQDADYEE